MRILQVISSLDPRWGGPIEAVRQLSESLVGDGHQVEIVSLDRPDARFLREFPLPVHATGPSWFKYHYNPRLVPWLKTHAAAYDAVIVNGLWQYHGFAVWRVLARSQTPYFVYTHGMLDPWFKHAYPLKHLKKWLYWPWTDYRVLRDARAVLFTCDDERILARSSFGLYRCTEAIAPLGIVPPVADSQDSVARFLAAFPALKEKRVALFLGRITEKKACDVLIEAFSQVADTDSRLQLVMVGPDNTGWSKELQKLTAARGIAERVTWIDMLQGDLKWGAFHAAEIFCLPSHQENFGIVIVEALVCGKPVLISRKVNIWREIAHDGAGFVDDDTVAGTVRSLRRWLALSEQEYKSMGDRAMACFQQRFHVRRASERLIEVLTEHTL